MESSGVSALTIITSRLLPEPHAGLLSGLLFGTKASLSREFYDALVASGTLHIVALSGMNISIMTRLIQSCLMWWLGRRLSGIVTLGVIAWFVWFVGISPSILRASLMGGIAILAILFGRQYWTLCVWGITSGIMLLVYPLWISDVSFQLSVLATLGIILFGDTNISVPLNEKNIQARAIMKKMIGENMRLTMAAQVFTIPVILWHFHRISLIAPLSNVLIGWVIGPLTALGWATIFLGFLWFPMGYMVSWVDWILLEYIVRIVYFMSSVPFASIGG